MMKNDETFDDLDDVEVIDFDDEEEITDYNEPVYDRPYSPWRLYFTGIITGVLILTVAMLVCDLFNLHPFSQTPASDKVYDLSKTVESYIDKYYWKSNTTDDEFANMAAKGMVAALNDPYSMYLTKEEMDRLGERNDGEYVGIGIVVGIRSGKKVITNIATGKPGDVAGLKVDDEIIAVDGVDITKETLDETIARIRGKAGTSHVLTVIRPVVASGSAASESGNKMDITVVTENIVNKSIIYQMLRDHVGYIHILSFDRETPKQFKKAIEELEKKNMKSLVLDVRNNGGGVLSAVLSVLNRLLPAGTILTETHKDTKDTLYKSTDDEKFDKPMVVLINGKSASAAEVFAGALQDRKAVPLIGEKSFGKGIMQSIYRFSDNGAGIKLTTGEYLLPSGRSIHEKGLTPTIEVKFTGKDDEYGTDNDNQLIRAVNELTS